MILNPSHPLKEKKRQTLSSQPDQDFPSMSNIQWRMLVHHYHSFFSKDDGFQALKWGYPKMIQNGWFYNRKCHYILDDLGIPRSQETSGETSNFCCFQTTCYRGIFAQDVAKTWTWKVKVMHKTRRMNSNR